MSHQKKNSTSSPPRKNKNDEREELTWLSGSSLGRRAVVVSAEVVSFLLICCDQVFFDVNGGVIRVLLLELCNLSPQLGVFPAESIVLILLCRVSPLVTGDMGKGIIF